MQLLGNERGCLDLNTCTKDLQIVPLFDSSLILWNKILSYPHYIAYKEYAYSGDFTSGHHNTFNGQKCTQE